MTRTEKILGCLVGAATGDAMGGPTEMRTRKQIEEKFGGYVNQFLPAPEDTFARGNKPGQVTDDFSQAYLFCVNLLRNNGKVDRQFAIDTLIEWSEDEAFFNRFAGPTTRAAILSFRSGTKTASKYGFDLVNENDKSTNGAAMKVGPIALFSNGDIDRAIRDALIVSEVTHNNNVALASAASVAAATSAAMRPESTLEEIFDAAIYGGEQGDAYGRKHGQIYANPSYVLKLKQALSIGFASRSISEAIDEIADLIGLSVMAYESVPAAFGLMAAARGDVCEAIYASVNAGNDTDSLATIGGAVLGAWQGIKAFPASYLNILNDANGYDLCKTATEINEFLERLS